MPLKPELMTEIEQRLDETALDRVEEAVEHIVAAKERGGKVAVVTGSGPNVHEGVTTLIAEMMRVGLVDAVSTSSAVVAHEMGGTLDEVKRCPGKPLGIPPEILPRGGEFELSLVDDDTLDAIERYMPLDRDLIDRLRAAEGKTIIKAAGNLGYPMGLYLEWLSNEISVLAKSRGLSFEETAGLGADPRTMIGVGARKGLPVLVTIPQLVGGGAVGLCIGDTISLHERASRLAHMLDDADVIIESAVALTQEVHDGPFERYTGHGMWSAWTGHYSYSLEGKTLIRIDLDPALNTVWEAERGGGAVQQAIAEGLPKTKLFKVPFRMEMSGFARHEGSIPIVGDIGAVWPLIAYHAAKRLGIALGFISAPQDTEAGKEMRRQIVKEVQPLDREQMLKSL
ncbi:MAG: hypothetical protein GXY07_11040 [Candidatus Hydrogenedentes bacterium]|nr:hypothetical protein [Candidatus Hydrogenedentota bacterium]